MTSKQQLTKTTKPSTSIITNAFIGKKEKPTDSELASALGHAKLVWDQLLTELAQEHLVNIHEWKCHSVKWGWTLRVMRGKRTILWLSPRPKCFGVLFILGAKAMSAVHQEKFPKRVIKAISEATKYPEGTGIRMEIRNQREVVAVKKLATIKLAN